jgi:hypothetical protein
LPLSVCLCSLLLFFSVLFFYLLHPFQNSNSCLSIVVSIGYVIFSLFILFLSFYFLFSTFPNFVLFLSYVPLSRSS